MLLAWLAACTEKTPETDPSTLDTATVSTETTDTGDEVADTGTVPAVETTTDCFIVGDWDIQIRGWIDKGWTASFRQSDVGCYGEVWTDIDGTVVVEETVVNLDGTYTAVGTYTGLFQRSPTPLLLRPVADGWEVDGQMVALGSFWSMTPAGPTAR